MKPNTVQKKIDEKKLSLLERHPDGHKRAGQYVVWGRARAVVAAEIAELEGQLTDSKAARIAALEQELSELKGEAVTEPEPAKATKAAPKKKASKKVAKKKASKRTAAVKKAAEKKPDSPYALARQAQKDVLAKHGLGGLEVSDLYRVIAAAQAELDARHESGKRKGKFVLWGRARNVKQAEIDGLTGIKDEALAAYTNTLAVANGTAAKTGTEG